MKRAILITLILLCGLTLFSQNAPITVTSPNGGENWAIGSTQIISWVATDAIGNVKIQLVRNNSAANLITIAENIPSNIRNFTWTLPANLLAGSGYKVRISKLSNTPTGVIVYDESDGYFAITNNTPPPMAITVTSPNGGENWAIGSTHPITWVSSGLTGYVRIELQSPLAMFAPMIIASEVPVQSGFYNWSINNILPASYYQVSITWITDMAVYIGDVSDAAFTISGNTPEPTLTVLSPNGGESWQIGNTYNINWDYTNLEGYVRIDLVSPLDNILPTIINEIPVANRTFAWSIPTNLPPASFYRIMISKINSNGTGISDISDGDFAVTGVVMPMSITVTSPNGGENWAVGSTHQITWNYTNLTGNVMITLETPYPTFAPVVIADNVPIDTGVYNWSIPEGIIPMEGYSIAICWSGMLTVYIGDVSDGTFTISDETTAPAITVTSPNGGEVWAKGTIHQITWAAQGFEGNVQIGLIRANSTNTGVLVIARNAPNNGVFNWRIPLRIPNGAYKVVIRSRLNNSIIDYSDASFTINGGNIIPFYVTPTLKSNDGQVAFNINTESSVALTAEVYNIKGQLVKKIADHEVVTGKKVLTWNGVSNSGKMVNKGVYFVKVKSGNQVITRKFIY